MREGSARPEKESPSAPAARAPRETSSRLINNTRTTPVSLHSWWLTSQSRRWFHQTRRRSTCHSEAMGRSVVEIVVMASLSRGGGKVGIRQKDEVATARNHPWAGRQQWREIPTVSCVPLATALASVTIAAEATLAVATTGLTKEFGDRRVVDNLDLAIPRESVCGFVGPNGAGKTTTIRMLLGLIRPTSGDGQILSGDIHDPSSYLARVGALIESPAFYPSLSGRDNLLVLTRLGQLPVSTIDDALERVGLADRAEDRFSRYSLGMKQRLGIAAALLAEPSLLILDEPTNGLDPAGIVEMRSLIRSLAERGYDTLRLEPPALRDRAHLRSRGHDPERAERVSGLGCRTARSADGRARSPA